VARGKLDTANGYLQLATCDMRLILLGTGAMACLFGARLAPVADVTLLGTWAEGLAAIETHGIVVEDTSGASTTWVHAARLGAEIEPADLVLVLVKAWQTESVARHLDFILTPNGLTLTLQNGVGNLEKLGPRARLGVTTQGATLLGPGRVRPGGAGPTHIAGPEWIVELFQRAGFEAHRADAAQVDGLAWGKLVVNCGINALTALLRVPNGELLERPNAALLMERAATECAAVARAKGIALPFPDPVARVREVAQKTAVNRSSMFQDILRGAPTEIEAINGAVVREGERLGVPAPVNETLWRLVRSLTTSGS
jgi:2-dehydropantoate 2-reductase